MSTFDKNIIYFIDLYHRLYSHNNERLFWRVNIFIIGKEYLQVAVENDDSLPKCLCVFIRDGAGK